MSAYSDLVIAQGATYYYQMEEISGTIASSTGSTALDMSIDISVVKNVAGAVGQNFSFPGLGSGRLFTAANAAMKFDATKDFSYSLWFNLSSKAGNRGLIAKRDSTTTGRSFACFVFGTPSGGALSFDIGSNQIRWSTTFIPEIDRWYHVAFTYAGATTKLERCYIDGVFYASNSGASANTQTADAPIEIGTLPPQSNPMNGYIDEVAVFMDKLLTAEEIAMQYQTATPIIRIFDGTKWVTSERKIM